MVDVVEAGRAWLRGGLSTDEYVAVVRREVRGPGWWARLVAWLRRQP